MRVKLGTRDKIIVIMGEPEIFARISPTLAVPAYRA